MIIVFSPKEFRNLLPFSLFVQAITKSHNEKRECIMRQFVKCDLMNLGGKLILRCLLMPAGLETPHPIQQSAARLLNALTSIQSGRSYLSQNSETVKATSAVLQQQGGYRTDTFTKNMLVAALQKLSLRYLHSTTQTLVS